MTGQDPCGKLESDLLSLPHLLRDLSIPIATQNSKVNKLLYSYVHICMILESNVHVPQFLIGMYRQLSNDMQIIMPQQQNLLPVMHGE